MNQPEISVILPVFNAAAFLKESIQSILKQSITNFELIIINDGSTDGSQAIIDSFKDPRIISVVQANIGLAATLNRGIGMARAEIIARQDNDDISYLNRFEQQFNFLKTHPDIVLLGTAARIIDQNGKPLERYHRHPTNSDTLKFLLLFDNPFVHSSVMFRKAAVTAVGGYDTNVNYFEDYRLWSHLSRAGKIANLSEVLVDYREVETGMSKTAHNYHQKVIRQSIENIAYLLTHYSLEDLKRFVGQSRGEGPFTELTKDFKAFDTFLRDVSMAFERQYKPAKENLQLVTAKIRKQFLRAYYNTVIQTPGIGTLTKFIARIKRRIIIMQMKS
jgi:glycosyltransferase involved in cell wall biosynthesis